VKVLPPAFSHTEEKIRRFRREAKAAAALHHPCIAQVLEYGAEGEVHFIVMELVAGQTISELIGKGRFSEERATAVALQVLAGLEAAHRAGIIHRDIKPSNLMLTPEGTVKILDFGLAKIDRVNASFDMSMRSLTATGTVVGTVCYMSPEQILAKPVDARSDLFSFGVVLYEMLAGRLPFSGNSILDTFERICREDPAPLRQARPEISDRLYSVVTRCLAKAPTDRFQSAAETADALSAKGGRDGFGWLRRIWKSFG